MGTASRSSPTGHVYGIDHGLTFHVGPKLRTVIWDFASEPVPEDLVADLEGSGACSTARWATSCAASCTRPS